MFEQLDRLDSAARRHETPCGDGRLVWREWGAGPPLILLHGGAGSWRHWLRNIEHFAQGRRVLVPDLPGLGDSSDPPTADSPELLGRILWQGLEILAPDEPLPLVGFSFGGIVGAHAGPLLGDRLAGLALVGTGGLALPGGETLRPQRIAARMSPLETADVHRANLTLLMFGDPHRIDALALEIHSQNVRRARLRERAMARSGTLLAVLPRLSGQLLGIWGEFDAFARPHVQARLDRLAELRPDCDAEIAPRLGHWIPYEDPLWFNARLDAWLATTVRAD